MNESRELKNAEQLEELLLLTEEIQEELEQKDQLIVELKTQLNESLTLNEKLNKENRAGNIQALKNDLKLADRALRNEKEKLRSANVMIGEYQNKIRCLTQQRDYARTHQKIVDEYSCAVTPQVRQTGNRLSGLAGTAYASLLA